MTEKKFIKQTITVTILTEGYIPEWDTLSDVDYLITDGEAVGDITIESNEKISEEEVKKLLIKFGSEPGYFGLEDDDEEDE